MFSFSDIPWIFFMMPALMCIIPFPSSYHLWANSSWCLRIQVNIIFSTKAYLAPGAWILSPSMCSHLLSWTFLTRHRILLGLWAFLSVSPSRPAVSNLLGTGSGFEEENFSMDWVWGGDDSGYSHLLISCCLAQFLIDHWLTGTGLWPWGDPCSRMQMH